jgi:hypothetical protein
LFISLLVSSCTHTISKYSNEQELEFYNRIGKICESKDDITVETVDKVKYQGGELSITLDTTSFIDYRTNQFIVKNTQEISSISFSEMSRGAFEGFLYGAMIGGGVGLSSQLINLGGAPKGDIYFILYSAITGAVAGVIYGLINPSKTIIKIN